ncbi:MAG: hypothetical protein CVV02_15800 [Firmicutes bacterium HGW-Firmicutes-7]|nr:MAG: hypothetical protein CVV02_15800 [Firmicutes bacterium HGW-Firmicutes-7]
MLEYEGTASSCQLDTKILHTFLEYRALRLQFSHTSSEQGYKLIEGVEDLYPLTIGGSKKALDIMRRYIYQYYKESTLEVIDQRFLERFYSCFLPSQLLRVTYKEIESLSTEWTLFFEFIGNRYDKTLLKSSCTAVFKSHEEDLHRILYLIKEVRKYGEVPVLCWEPFIIDMKCYKNMKVKENALDKYIIYDQGYFVIQDRLGNNIILFKNSPVKTFYKIKIDIPLGEEMKMGDIIHMSIKRKLFSTAWNIINVKAYFDESAGEYLNLGGKGNEASKNS